MLEELISQCSEKMDKAINNLKEGLSTIRAGSVSPNVLDKILCNVYGEMTPIKQLATIQATGALSLVVKPFDPSTTKDINAAIAKSDLGINPAINGNEIRLNFPPLTGERRQEFVKKAKEYCEQAKLAIRNIRRDMNDHVKKEKDLAKDVAKDLENDIQKQTDKHIKEIDELLAKKEKEITSI